MSSNPAPTIDPSNGLLALNRLNPLTPPIYGGVTTPDGDADFTYPYDVTLTAGQHLDDVIKTNTDADFQMTAIVINQYTSINFSFRLDINGVYFMSSAEIFAANLQADPSSPFPILGQFIIPRGADLNVHITDLSGAGNTIEILFRGVKKYGLNNR